MRFRVFVPLLLGLLFSFVAGCASDDDYVNFQTSSLSGDPVRLEFETVPLRAAGTTFSTITVAIVDRDGAVVANNDREVRIRLAEPNGAILSGLTAVRSVNGIATFSGLSVDKVGNYTFIAEADGLLSDESTVITITSGPALTVSFLQPPPPTPDPDGDPDETNSVTVGQPFAKPISVEVRDAFGNLVSESVTVQLRIVRDTVGGVTVSNNVATTQNGVATFPDFTIDSGGGIMVMAAAVDADTFVASEPFFVAGPYSLYITTFPGILNGTITPDNRPFLFRLNGGPRAPIGGPVVDFIEVVTGMVAMPDGRMVIAVSRFVNDPSYLAILNTETGIATAIGSGLVASNSIATDLTVDPVTGTLYTYLYDRVNKIGQLCTVDTETGLATPVGAATSPLESVALTFDVFQPEGPVLYGIGNATPGFTDATYVTFDLTTGVTTPVGGAVPLPAQICRSLVVYPFNPNLLLGIFQTADSDFALKTIDKATGATVGTPSTGLVASVALVFQFP